MILHKNQQQSDSRISCNLYCTMDEQSKNSDLFGLKCKSCEKNLSSVVFGRVNYDILVFVRYYQCENFFYHITRSMKFLEETLAIIYRVTFRASHNRVLNVFSKIRRQKEISLKLEMFRSMCNTVHKKTFRGYCFRAVYFEFLMKQLFMDYIIRMFFM